jgi:hypothetical protein
MQFVPHLKYTTNTDSPVKSTYKRGSSLNASIQKVSRSDCAFMGKHDRSRRIATISYWIHASLSDISIASATMQPGVNNYSFFWESDSTASITFYLSYHEHLDAHSIHRRRCSPKNRSHFLPHFARSVLKDAIFRLEFPQIYCAGASMSRNEHGKRLVSYIPRDPWE